jgi:predicted dehydrogenase
MKIVIIGLGSIGKRHVQAIQQIHPDASIYAVRSKADAAVTEGVFNIYSLAEIDFEPDFFIISNPTIEHEQTLRAVAAFKVPLFIEKPVLHQLAAIEELKKSISSFTYIACNLRFFESIQFLKNYLQINAVQAQEVSIYCGSYLPDWRPNVDFKTIYSANENQGGGVHLDLIHELDYCVYLFGMPAKSTHFWKKNSSLGINAIDSAHYVFEYETFLANITLNYFRRDAKRTLEIVTPYSTIVLNLLTNTVTENGLVLFQSAQTSVDTYLKQMQYFLTEINQNRQPMNNFDEACSILALVF